MVERAGISPSFGARPGPERLGPEEARLADEEDKNTDDLSKVASAYRKAAPILDAVWQLVGATALGTLAGWWLDKKLHTTPWLLISGALLGVGAGMYAFLRASLAASRRPPRRDGPSQGRGDPPGA